MANYEKQFSEDTPFSMENFMWLMENSAAKNYLGGDTLALIDKAIAETDEEYLSTLYGDILNEYLLEQSVDLNFAIQEDKLVGDFEESAIDTGKKVKKERKKKKYKIEIEEKKLADSILKRIK